MPVWDNAHCLGRRYADIGDYGRYVGELQCGEIKTWLKDDSLLM